MNSGQLPVILVDDEEEILLGGAYLLQSHAVGPVVTIQDARQLLPRLDKEPAGVVVLDLLMPHLPGKALLPQIASRHPEVPVVVMTALQDVDTAVACMKEGAFDYLVKPVEENRFVSAVKRALEIRALRRQIGSLRHSLMADRLENPQAFSAIITNNTKMHTVFHYVEAIADSGEPVLVTGETGTGKELLARAIHAVSRLPGKLVALNVAGLDDSMFSDALFGHLKGAFSGAERDREGMVAQAENGTLFLDEIGDLPPTSQVKLLRLLQDRQYYPLGSDVPKLSNARIVAATNRNLQKMMARGEFRQDLFFRLSSHPVEIPPLRRRRDDLPLLLRHFIVEAAEAMGKTPPDPPEELLTLLSVYHFPGNVRELRAMVYNAVAQHRSGRVLSMESFKNIVRQERASAMPVPAEAGDEEEPPLEIPGRFPTLKEADEFLVQEAMRRAKDNQGVAATLLGITRQSLNRRVQIMRGGG